MASDRTNRGGGQIVFWRAAGAVLLAFVLWRQIELSRRLDSRKEPSSLSVAAEAENAPPEENNASALLPSRRIFAPEASSARVSELDRRMQAMEEQAAQLLKAARASGPAVPEYDPTMPWEEPALEEQAAGWGAEQAAGPPNCDTSQDSPNAWASQNADGGAEWLSVMFEQPVEMAEVRIRENHNPGAISKVAAIVDGMEVVLWEGTAAAGKRSRDFLARASGSVSSQSVIIYLDTARVPGWNEIDAVELVGRDGSRQWASTARASSSYGAPSAGFSKPLRMQGRHGE